MRQPLGNTQIFSVVYEGVIVTWHHNLDECVQMRPQLFHIIGRELVAKRPRELNHVGKAYKCHVLISVGQLEMSAIRQRLLVHLADKY